ncbi:MAG: hypothetical protein ARM1_0610 [Candidatus Micrarchaeota archaeon]|nr:MAG: hypothetical protein ARM1_0610 [Candidatus Micrarchaeota archaeon]
MWGAFYIPVVQFSAYTFGKIKDKKGYTLLCAESIRSPVFKDIDGNTYTMEVDIERTAKYPISELLPRHTIHIIKPQIYLKFVTNRDIPINREENSLPLMLVFPFIRFNKDKGYQKRYLLLYKA